MLLLLLRPRSLEKDAFVPPLPCKHFGIFRLRKAANSVTRILPLLTFEFLYFPPALVFMGWNSVRKVPKKQLFQYPGCAENPTKTQNFSQLVVKFNLTAVVTLVLPGDFWQIFFRAAFSPIHRH